MKNPFSLRDSWRRAVGTIPLVVVAVCVAMPALAAPAGGSLAVTLRAGTAQEAVQHTLENGLAVGLLVDLATGGPVDFGLGLNFVRDAGGGATSRNRVLVTSLDAHIRSSLRRRSHVELGLGYYWLDSRNTSPRSGLASLEGVGGSIGTGLELWRRADLGVGLAIAYHAIAAKVSYGGGNLEDFYTLAATVRWGVPPR